MRRIFRILSIFILFSLLIGCDNKDNKYNKKTTEQFKEQYHTQVSFSLETGENLVVYSHVRVRIKPNQEVEDRDSFIVRFSAYDGDDAFKETIIVKYYEIKSDTVIDETFEGVDIHYVLTSEFEVVETKGQDKGAKVLSSNVVTVNFDSRGGTPVPTQYVNVGETINTTNPTKDGLKFLFWSSSLENPSPYLLERGTTKNITLYAFYDEKINIELNYCDNVTKETIISQTVDLNYNLPNPNRKGYVFQGWYIDNSYSKKMDENTIVSKGVTKLYAKWEIVEYNIDFIVKTGEQKNNNIYKYNVETDTITLKDGVKIGYTFKGWYNNEHLLGSPIKTIIKGSTGNIKLYPMWEANVYNVTLFFDDELNGETQTIKAKFDDFYPNLPVPTKEGFIFEGWYKDKNSYSSLVGFTTGGHKYYSDNKVNTPSNHGLYAKWVVGTSGLEFNLKDNHWEVISYIGIDTKINIPSKLSGLPVSSVGSKAFEGMKLITEIVVPDSVKTIGVGAFGGMSSLVKLTIPIVGGKEDSKGKERHFGYLFNQGSIPETALAEYYEVDFLDGVIGSWFTYYLPKTLKEVKVTNAKSIKDYAFKNIRLEKIELNEGLVQIGQYAFSDMVLLEQINIPSTVTSIGQYAFSNSSKIPAITIPDGVTRIEKGTFNNLNLIQNIMIPANITYIGDSAFKGLSLVTNVIIPDGVTYIGSEAFAGWLSLTTLNLPTSLENIGSKAFEGMKLITEIVVPDSVKTIGVGAFGGMSSLVKLTIPIVGGKEDSKGKERHFGYLFNQGSIPETALAEYYEVDFLDGVIGSWFTYYLPKTLKEVKVTNAKSIKDYAFKNIRLEKIELNEGLVQIGQYAFSDMVLLEQINIPSTVTSIGQYAFSNSSKIPAITIPDGVTRIEKGTFNNLNLIQNIMIPANITYIGDSAFKGLSLVTNVIIPDGVTYIGSEAFAGWLSLTTLNLPTSLENIGSKAFEGMKLITEIVVPDSVKTIGVGAFGGMSSLVKLTIPIVGGKEDSKGKERHFGYLFNQGSIPETALAEYYEVDFLDGVIGSWFTYYLPKTLKEVKVTNAKSIKDYAFKNIRLEKIELNEGLVQIGQYAFSDMVLLEQINIPSTVTSIGQYAFSNSSKIPAITIPDGVTRIEKGTFNNLNLIQNIMIPANITYIGDSAFKGLSLVTNVIIPDGVTYIGSEAFAGWLSLTTLNLPTSLENIGSKAFEGMKLITEIVVPDSVKTIGVGAFGGMSSLVKLTIPIVGGKEDSKGKERHFGYLFNQGSIPETALAEYYEVDFLDGVIGSWFTYYLPKTLKEVKVTNAKSIKDYAFKNIRLEKIELNEGLVQIGQYAFSDMLNLTTIVIPSSVITIGANAFQNPHANFIINCVVSSKPEGWNNNWNPSNKTVNWGYIV
ncbi:MAG: leucine-rich repeat protein [Acholeplasmataceae bacterium]